MHFVLLLNPVYKEIQYNGQILEVCTSTKHVYKYSYNIMGEIESENSRYHFDGHVRLVCPGL